MVGGIFRYLTTKEVTYSGSNRVQDGRVGNQFSSTLQNVEGVQEGSRRESTFYRNQTERRPEI